MEKEVILRLQYLFGEFLENANNIITQGKDRQNKLHIDNPELMYAIKPENVFRQEKYSAEPILLKNFLGTNEKRQYLFELQDLLSVHRLHIFANDRYINTLKRLCSVLKFDIPISIVEHILKEYDKEISLHQEYLNILQENKIQLQNKIIEIENDLRNIRN
jgi:hypothetical protein